MFNKEIIIITGAGQGIGRQIAKSASEIYDLVLISKTQNCKKTKEEILRKKMNTNRKLFYLKKDLSKNYSLIKFFNKIKLGNYSAIHLILCAGVVDNQEKSYLNINDWHKVFNINLFGNIKIINTLIPIYKKLKKQSKIIIFSGGGAANSFKEFPIYSASKTALIRTIENYSLKFKKLNLSIFGLAPGAVKTKMLTKVLKIAKVGTKSNKNDVSKFINLLLNHNTHYLNGKLVHIKDNLIKIKKNKNINYLKLRRVE